MIAVLKSSIASGLTLGAAACGPVEDAYGQEPQGSQNTKIRTIDDMAEDLALPIDRTAAYFNRATNTAIVERCEKVGADTVICNQNIMGVTAQIRYSQTSAYRLAPNGQVSVSTQVGAAQNWSSSVQSNFDRTREKAAITEWTKDSPLAEKSEGNGTYIIQNDILEVKRNGSGGVMGYSIAPVSDERGLAIYMGFNKTGQSVTLAVMPTITPGDTAPATGASRPFNEYDRDYYEQYRSHVTGVPTAYILRQ